MMAASVLLNFSGCVNFTPTDPLIGMVRAGASLLSYDLLSVNTFSRKAAEQREQIRKKVAELRNMLEDRCLSSADKGERIRLMVILDFSPWRFLLPEASMTDDDFDAAFPTLKVDFLKDTVQEIFGQKNALLRRFDWNILFTDDTTDEERSRRYRLVGWHGYGKQATVPGWISTEDAQLCARRSEALDAMNAPDAALPLTHPAILPHFSIFKAALEETLQRVTAVMKKIGREQAFKEASLRLQEPRTVHDFMQMDYDRELLHIIQQVAGLGADRFRDCTFFVLCHRLNIKTQKSRDGIVLRSLIQLLCTMSEDDYRQQFRPRGDRDFHKFLILENPDDDEIQVEAMRHYRQDIERFGEQLGGSQWSTPGGKLAGMRWKSSLEVTYLEYLPPEPHGAGGHEGQNEKTRDTSRDKEWTFKQRRRIPFFLGTGPSDWRWFHDVTEALQACSTFEEKSLGMLTESTTRSDNADFSHETRTITFADLGEAIKAIEGSETREVNSTVDHDRYIAGRKRKVQELQMKGDEMKRQLVKLGFRSRLLWIAFLASLAFTLCYAYHFIYRGQQEQLLWIAAGFGAMVLLFLLSMVIAHLMVKGKIEAVYREIDLILDGIRDLDREHLESVNKLVAEMNAADAQHKTLSGMRAKYDEWTSHNKKVELWVSYARNMVLLLDHLLLDLGVTDSLHEVSVGGQGLMIDDTILAQQPSVIGQIRSQDYYTDMAPKVCITSQSKENTIPHVTCFVSHFRFQCVQP